MRVGKKVIAGILAAVMVVSSMQVSTGTVYAEELLEEAVEVDGGAEELEEEAEADGVTEKLEEEETDGATGELEEVEAGSGTEGLEKAEGEISGAYQFGGRPSGEVVSSDSSGVFVDGTAEEGSVEEYLYQQILARNEEINIYSYNIAVSDLGNIIGGILNEYPELYFVNRSFSHSYSGTIVYSVSVTYNDGYDDAAFQTAKTEALSVVEQGMSDLEKAIVLHDYLAVNCEYDKVNYNAGTIPDASYSAYGVLVNRIAVCNGYALAYKYLLNEVGIECYMVTSSSMNHAWNLVVLDGQYYQVDVTWDDPTWDLIGRVCHNNMFLSDSAFTNHSNWEVTSGSEVVNYKAKDTRYDSAFWTNCRSPLVLIDDDCYYISSDDRAVMKGALDNVTDTGTGICDIGIWQVWGNSYSYWPGAYSGLFQVNNRLYYNDMNSIYSIALDGTDKSIEFTADTTEGYIYGSALCQGKVLYSLHQTPNLDAVETVLTADIVFESEEPVIVPVESVTLSADSLTLTEQESATLTVTISPENATETDVTWTSSDESVATVEGGVVTAVASGNCIISATAGEKTDSCNVNVVVATVSKETVEISGITIQDSVYNGEAASYSGSVVVKKADNTEITGQVELIYSYSGIQADGSNYASSEQAPANAGEYTLTVSVTEDNGEYAGSVEYLFKIDKAPVVITAASYTLYVEDALPNVWQYETTGLLNDDALIVAPSFSYMDEEEKEISRDNINMDAEGRYFIIPGNADAGMNYEITYHAGVLTIIEKETETETETESEPETESEKETESEPESESEIETETEETNKDEDLYIEEVQNPTYTGKALKPTVEVYSGEEGILLKAGKDYTIKYYNNIEADTEKEANEGGTNRTGIEGENGFSKDLAYVVITGKGNYTGTIYQNFHINAASVSRENEDGSLGLATGFSMKYTDQLVTNSKKSQKPLQSLKYKKAMIAGKDYKVKLTGINAYDENGKQLETGSIISENSNRVLPAIPAGYKGSFLMTVTGIGNYTGEVTKTIYVADKQQLIKNAAISLGKNQKTIKDKNTEALKEGITLTPAYYDAAEKKYYAITVDGTIDKNTELNKNEVFTVKAGKEYLIWGKDYTISYENNKAVGTATMTVTGIGEYIGTKSIKFKIAGTAFNEKNIVVDSSRFKTSMHYTGMPLTQDDVVLYPKDGNRNNALVFEKDYTISYKNNVQKGTATMIFTANPASGYSGSFKKSFNITAAELSDMVAVSAIGSSAEEGTAADIIKYETDGNIYFNEEVAYTKAGAEISDRIQLVNKESGVVLKAGSDYKVSYKNNKAVTVRTAMTTNERPCMTITGKGNYEQTINIYFDISEGVLAQDNISVTAMALNTKNNYEYQPKVNILDGKKALAASKEYILTYENNDQTNVTKYINNEVDAKTPVAVIQLTEESNYKLVDENGAAVKELRVPLKIYKKALKKSELYVVIEEPVYTGRQLKPSGDAVKVYIGTADAVKAARRAGERDEQVLTAENGNYGLSKLTENTDYILNYGVNITAGKNKGKIIIIGNSKEYGGSVTVKFTILNKGI